MGGKQAAGRQVLRGKANSSRDLEITLSYKGEKGWGGGEHCAGLALPCGTPCTSSPPFQWGKVKGGSQPIDFPC